MGTRAIILFALILFFAALFLAGLVTAVRGVVKKRKQALAQGPVPREVLLCCSGPTWDDLGPERLMTSDKVWYAAEETCCEELPYHGGALMIIDPELSRVWVAAWDH